MECFPQKLIVKVQSIGMLYADHSGILLLDFILTWA